MTRSLRMAWSVLILAGSAGCGGGSRVQERDAAAEVGSADVEGEGTGPDASGTCGHCPRYTRIALAGTVAKVLDELSGLASSRRFPGWFYANNDSSDGPRIFLLDSTAALVAELDLTGASTEDLEDLTVGPCPSGTCVYIADTGDNNLDRSEYALYRIAEPDQLPVRGGPLSVAYERFPFTYPDGFHDAETVLVHPASGRIFVVTKDPEAASRVYEMPLPLTSEQATRLVLVATLSVPKSADMVTAGAFHPCEERLLIRTRDALFELSAAPGDGDPVSLFKAPPVEVPVGDEVQGEAVTYSLDGLGYYTSGEAAGGPQPALTAVSCPP